MKRIGVNVSNTSNLYKGGTHQKTTRLKLRKQHFRHQFLGFIRTFRGSFPMAFLWLSAGKAGPITSNTNIGNTGMYFSRKLGIKGWYASYMNCRTILSYLSMWGVFAAATHIGLHLITIQEISNGTFQTDPYLIALANPYSIQHRRGVCPSYFLGGLLVRSRSVFLRY